MKSAPILPNEAERLKALEEYQMMYSLPEETYDEITKIAAEICGTPIALMNMVGQDEQWTKSAQGLKLQITPRAISFCSHTIADTEDIMIVEDARYDERFFDNPLTNESENPIIFYAGVPLKDDQGMALGALCVVDQRPRQLSEAKVETLKALAKLINVHLLLHKTRLQLKQEISSKNELKNAAQPLLQSLKRLEDNGDLSDQDYKDEILKNANQLKSLTETL